MPKYLVDRDVPGVHEMDGESIGKLAAASNQVLRGMGPGIQWVQSYVQADHLVCVYHADTPELIREHARQGGFPCDAITEVACIIDPVTGETV